jgi:hypothetical protein
LDLKIEKTPGPKNIYWVYVLPGFIPASGHQQAWPSGDSDSAVITGWDIPTRRLSGFI